MESKHVGDWIALATLIVTIIGVWVAVVTLRRGNKNASVAALVALNESFREAWQRFHRAQNDEQRAYELAELLNLLEIACGIECEKSLTGISQKLMKDYLNDVLGILIKDEYTNQQIPKMLHAPSTFCNIKRFLKSKPKHLSVTIPLEWYQASA
jgi:hypothetical protein